MRNAKNGSHHVHAGSDAKQGILNEEALDKLGWTGADLAHRAKGDARKIRIAQRLRVETAVTLKWIAAELHMGTLDARFQPAAKREGQMHQPTNANSDLRKYSGLPPLGLLLGLVIAFITGCGPSPQKRPAEAAEIKTNYLAFRAAVINSNWPVIRSFLSQDFEKIYLKDKIYHRGYLTAESVPTTNAFVEFDSATEAWLRPNSGATQVGIGFLKETNGWKVSGRLKPILD